MEKHRKEELITGVVFAVISVLLFSFDVFVCYLYFFVTSPWALKFLENLSYAALGLIVTLSAIIGFFCLLLAYAGIKEDAKD